MSYQPEELTVNILGLGSITLRPNKNEQDAAWSLFVELTTRVAIQPFADEEGSMRGA